MLEMCRWCHSDLTSVAAVPAVERHSSAPVVQACFHRWLPVVLSLLAWEQTRVERRRLTFSVTLDAGSDVRWSRMRPNIVWGQIESSLIQGQKLWDRSVWAV